MIKKSIHRLHRFRRLDSGFLRASPGSFAAISPFGRVTRFFPDPATAALTANRARSVRVALPWFRGRNESRARDQPTKGLHTAKMSRHRQDPSAMESKRWSSPHHQVEAEQQSGECCDRRRDLNKMMGMPRWRYALGLTQCIHTDKNVPAREPNGN
jgi:hypothetical protein